jgi:hypothetical protein
VIAAELKSVCETEALAFSTVKKWLKRFAEGRASLYDELRCGRPLTSDSSEAVSSMLKERMYLSCKVICQHLRTAKGNRLRILHDTLGMKRFHLRWVPPARGTNQKAEGVNVSYGILSMLQRVRSTGFQRVITGDMSCFFLYYPRDSIRASSRDEVPDRVSQENDTEKRQIFTSLVLGVSMEFTPLLIFRKAAHRIQHSFVIFSDEVCLTELLYVPEENHSKFYTPIWTMHVRIRQDDPLNAFTQKGPAVTAPGVQPGTRTKSLRTLWIS